MVESTKQQSLSLQDIVDTLKSAKDYKDKQARIDVALDQLEVLSAQIIKTVSFTKDAVDGEVAKAEPVSLEAETGESVSIERAREILGEKLQIIEDVDEMLNADGWRVADSEQYPTTLAGTEKQLNDYVEHAITNTRKQEERDQTPFVSIDVMRVENINTGEKEDMTDTWILNWLKTTKNPNLKGKYAKFTSYVGTEERNKPGNGEWYYMYADGVAGSNKKTENGQVDYLTKKLGSGEMALASNLFKAVVLHCSKTGKMLFDDIWVRTESKDTVSDRVNFESWAGSGVFKLHSSSPGNASGNYFASRGGRSLEISQ